MDLPQEHPLYDIDGMPFNIDYLCDFIARTSKACGIEFNMYINRPIVFMKNRIVMRFSFAFRTKLHQKLHHSKKHKKTARISPSGCPN